MPPRQRRLSEADRAAWANYTRMIAPLRPALPVGSPSGPSFGPASGPPPGFAPGSSGSDIGSEASQLVAVPAAARPAAAFQLARSTVAPLAVDGQPGGLDGASWRRFRSGKLAAVRKLDLHGMTVQHAFHALFEFLRSAHAERLRCVEIVTGRGNGEKGGAIRRELPHWLNQPDIRPLVLGAAHPHPLNPGSVRLLLRRVR